MFDPYLDQPVDRPANPAIRFPIALCLDVSPSLRGEPIAELNHGLAALYAAVRDDPVTMASAQIGIFAFANGAEQIGPFDNLKPGAHPPRLEAVSGGAAQVRKPPAGGDLAAGVKLAVGGLFLRAKQNCPLAPTRRPLLVLMTDGRPMRKNYDRLAEQIREMDQNKTLTVWPLGVGPGADLTVLSLFAARRPALRLKGLDFAAFFRALAASAREVSCSQPDQSVRLDLELIRSFAEMQPVGAPVVWPAISFPPAAPPTMNGGGGMGGWCVL